MSSAAWHAYVVADKDKRKDPIWVGNKLRVAINEFVIARSFGSVVAGKSIMEAYPKLAPVNIRVHMTDD